MDLIYTHNPFYFRQNCTLKEDQLSEKGREVATLKDELGKKEKEKEELEKRTALEIQQKKKRIGELENDVSEKDESIVHLTSDKDGLLQEVDKLNSALSQRGEGCILILIPTYPHISSNPHKESQP